MGKKKGAEKKKLLEIVFSSGKRFSDATILFHGLVAEKAGLSGTDHKYLAILAEKGAMTAGELANITGLTTGAITGVIDRLEKRAMVKRVREEADRRKVLVVPDVEMAMQKLGPIFKQLNQKLEVVYNQFSETEMEVIIRHLNKVSDVMTELVKELKASK